MWFLGSCYFHQRHYNSSLPQFLHRKRSCDLEKENRGTIFVGIDLSTRLEAGKPSQKLTGVGICTIHVRVFLLSYEGLNIVDGIGAKWEIRWLKHCTAN